MALLKNVKVNWAEVHKENERYGGWSCEVEVTHEVMDQLIQMGVADKVKTTKADYSKEKGADGKYPLMTVNPYLKLRVYPTKKNKEPNKAPIVIDAMKRPFTENIGNGSVCNVSIHVWDKGDGTRGIIWKAIQVVKHIAYGDPLDEFEAVGGDEFESEFDAGVKDFEEDEVPFTMDDANDMYAPTTG